MRFAKGLKRRIGEMNKTEEAYRDHLEQRRIVGEVAWYSFEAVNLRLASNTYYRPDFMVMLSDGTLEVHEVKGFMRDDAAVKIKVAAEKFPFRFIVVKVVPKKSGGGWIYEYF